SSTTSPSSSPRCCTIAFARSGCERPEKTMSRFCGPRSIQCPCFGSVIVAPSSPGSVSSAVRLSMLVVDPPFLGFLARGEPGERSRRDIICDDRTRRNPSIVANVHGCIERIVDTGPDVAPDPCPALWLSRLVGKVGRDVAGRDVRVLTDLGVPDVGQMRDLRAGADFRLLDLDEGPDLGALPDSCPRPDVGEGADLHAGGDPDVAPENGEGVNRDV